VKFDQVSVSLLRVINKLHPLFLEFVFFQNKNVLRYLFGNKKVIFQAQRFSFPPGLSMAYFFVKFLRQNQNI
jgi:hypothetical protein